VPGERDDVPILQHLETLEGARPASPSAPVINTGPATFASSPRALDGDAPRVARAAQAPGGPSGRGQAEPPQYRAPAIGLGAEEGGEVARCSTRDKLRLLEQAVPQHGRLQRLHGRGVEVRNRR
jgi:hypothetical protein